MRPSTVLFNSPRALGDSRQRFRDDVSGSFVALRGGGRAEYEYQQYQPCEALVRRMPPPILQAFPP